MTHRASNMLPIMVDNVPWVPPRDRHESWEHSTGERDQVILRAGFRILGPRMAALASPTKLVEWHFAACTAREAAQPSRQLAPVATANYNKPCFGTEFFSWFVPRFSQFPRNRMIRRRS